MNPIAIHYNLIVVLLCFFKMKGYSRLRCPSNAEAHQCTEDKDPAVNRCKSTHQAVEHRPQNTQLQTLHVYTIKT